MSSSAITTQVAQLKIGNVQNQADSTSVYSNGVWSFKNSTALTSVTISDAGNVGIGRTTNLTGSVNFKAIGLGGSCTLMSHATSGASYLCQNLYFDGSVFRYLNTAPAALYEVGDSHAWFTTASGTAGAAATNIERMRIDASGNLSLTPRFGVGGIGLFRLGSSVTANANVNGYVQIVSSGTDPYGIAFQGTSVTQGYIGFYNTAAALQGSISKVNETTTAFNTGPSDYRLKEQVQELSGGLSKIKSLRPVSFVWKDSKKEEVGFIAHEIQAVIPECVTGEKDAVDAEGNPVYQSIFPAPAQMIANLVAAIQEQQAQIEALKAEVAALKAP